MNANKCKKIKLIISDVDGVLTDGGMYYSEKGEELKRFNTKDGMGVELLSNKDIKTIFMTKENSKIVLRRAKKVKVSDVYINIKSKESMLPKIMKKFSIKQNEIAYIGDDINDVEIMKMIGFSACPNDSAYSVKKIVDYVCKKKGGDGAFREIVDLIISYKISKSNYIKSIYK